MMEFLDYQFLDNSYRSIGLSILILLIGYVLRKWVSRFVTRILYRFFKRFSKENNPDEFVDLLVRPFQVFILLVTLYLALVKLNFPSQWQIEPEKIKNTRDLLHRIYGTGMILNFTWFILRVVDYIILIIHKRALETGDASENQIILFMKDLIKVVVVIMSIFFILGSIFGLNITSLIAGLGIGGLAIALAAQDTLSNLLASFIIFLDKPFKAGDTVSFDGITGTIEKVGFRSTKVRTLDKSLLTVPNKSLTDGPLNNITESPFRRVDFIVGLTYSTTADKIERVMDGIKAVLEAHEETKEDYTVVFSDFSASSLDIRVIYFVYSNEWGKMVKVKEEINFKIMRIVEENGCSFAFPTQTIELLK